MKKIYRYLPVLLTMGFLMLVQRDDAAGSATSLKISGSINRKPLTVEQMVGAGTRCSETMKALL